MVVAETSVKWYLSGGATNTNPEVSLGGARSNTAILQQRSTDATPTLYTLFDGITLSQRQNGYTDYRCAYIRNEGAQTIINLKLWQNVETPANDVVRIGYSGNAPNVAEQSTTEVDKELYSVPFSGTRNMGLDEERDRVGINIASPTAALKGKVVNKWTIYILKKGAPTGTLTVNCRNRNSETIRYTLGTLNVATLTADIYNTITFVGNATNIAFNQEDILWAEYSGGSAANHVTLRKVTGDPVKGVHAIARRKSPVSFEDEGNNDLAGKLYDTTATGGERTAPTGITFLNPKDEGTAIALPNLTANSWVGVWFKREVPAATGAYPQNKLELRLDYDSPST
jgi:hypothetical protein